MSELELNVTRRCFWHIIFRASYAGIPAEREIHEEDEEHEFKDQSGRGIRCNHEADFAKVRPILRQQLCGIKH